MDDAARETLINIIRTDRNICSDGIRLKGYLADFCPQARKEIRALIIGFEAKIPEKLLNASKGIPKNVLIRNLSTVLSDEFFLPEEISLWL